jgi:hypothetical protein
MGWAVERFMLPATAAMVLLIGAVQVGHSAAPQDFIDACQNDALRLCNQEAMSQNDARISACMRAHRRLVSARCLHVARKYKRL